MEDTFDDDSPQSVSDIQLEDESSMKEVRTTIPRTPLSPLSKLHQYSSTFHLHLTHHIPSFDNQIMETWTTPSCLATPSGCGAWACLSPGSKLHQPGLLYAPDHHFDQLLIVALITLPLRHLMARTLPTREFTLFGYDFSFILGSFSNMST